ncbi:MAG: SMR family transporter [Terrimicrobiaceae bacterium]|nr:SMR family transporter [Terrimicrobiaceae bacterium]
MMPWLYLTVAIFAEVIATSALKASTGFTKLLPSVIVVFGYICTFYALAQAFRTIDLGIAYAIWCGGGMVLLTLVGWLIYRQPLDTPALLGIGLILAGVMVLTLFSKSAPH